MDGMGRHTANRIHLRLPLVIIRKKVRAPPDAVSILPVGMRSLPEAEVHKKGLRLWKRAGRKERLAAVGGIVADSGYIDTGRWRWWQRICGTETEEMWDDEDFILG